MRKIAAASVWPLLAAFALFAPYIVLAKQVGVMIGDNYYGTKSIVVNAGDVVTWHNYGSAAHTVTSDGGYFNSQAIPPGQKFEYTFTLAGTYPYHDQYYGGTGGSGMSGTVTVVGATSNTGTTNTTNTSTAGSNMTYQQLQAQTEALLLLARAKYQEPEKVSSSACPTITRALSYGSSGAEVTSLQEYLATDPEVYPEGVITGYYGSLTRAAVQRWQSKHDVVSSGTPDTTGYGVVGPKTRAAIESVCALGGQSPDDKDVGGYFEVTPVAGKTPMLATIKLTINSNGSCEQSVYTLDFADGTSPLQFTSFAGVCQPQSITLTHLFQYGGSYPITLSAGSHKSSTSVVAVGPPPPDAQSVGGTSTQGTGAVATVDITDSSFAPARFYIPPGTQVVWTNNGSLQHTVTSDTAIFDSGTIAPGKTFSTVFNEEGTFPYYCRFHGLGGGIGMSGVVLVSKSAKAPAQQNTTSTSANTQTSNGTYSVSTEDTSGNPSSAYTKPEIVFSDGHKVTLSFNVKNSCDPYTWDWGDGTNTHIQGQGYSGCKAEGLKVLNYTYPDAGTYTILLSRGVGSLHTDTIITTVK